MSEPDGKSSVAETVRRTSRVVVERAPNDHGTAATNGMRKADGIIRQVHPSVTGEGYKNNGTVQRWGRKIPRRANTDLISRSTRASLTKSRRQRSMQLGTDALETGQRAMQLGTDALETGASSFPIVRQTQVRMHTWHHWHNMHLR